MDRPLRIRAPVTWAVLAGVWGALTPFGVQAQVVVQRPVAAAAAADLARQRSSAEAELRALESARDQACKTTPTSAECQRKRAAEAAARPGLLKRIESLKAQQVQATVTPSAVAAAAATAAAATKPTPAATVAPARQTEGTVRATAKPISPALNQRPFEPCKDGGCDKVQSGGPVALNTADPVSASTPSTSSSPSRPGGSTSGSADSSSSRRTGSATGCFIATAAYGSADAPVVRRLREFRDRRLLGHPLGDAFVAGYYRLSPPMADAIAERPWARAAVRAGLRGLVEVMDLPFLAWLCGLGAVAAVGWRARLLRAPIDRSTC